MWCVLSSKRLSCYVLNVQKGDAKRQLSGGSCPGTALRWQLLVCWQLWAVVWPSMASVPSATMLAALQKLDQSDHQRDHHKIGFKVTFGYPLDIDLWWSMCWVDLFFADKLWNKEMALFNPEVRRRTDALDAAGNTTAAIGKAFRDGVGLLYKIFQESWTYLEHHMSSSLREWKPLKTKFSPNSIGFALAFVSGLCHWLCSIGVPGSVRCLCHPPSREDWRASMTRWSLLFTKATEGHRGHQGEHLGAYHLRASLRATVGHARTIIGKPQSTEAFLIIGCMIPYWFAALTMKSVGKAENLRSR